MNITDLFQPFHHSLTVSMKHTNQQRKRELAAKIASMKRGPTALCPPSELGHQPSLFELLIPELTLLIAEWVDGSGLFGLMASCKSLSVTVTNNLNLFKALALSHTPKELMKETHLVGDTIGDWKEYCRYLASGPGKKPVGWTLDDQSTSTTTSLVKLFLLRKRLVLPPTHPEFLGLYMEVYYNEKQDPDHRQICILDLSRSGIAYSCDRWGHQTHHYVTLVFTVPSLKRPIFFHGQMVKTPDDLVPTRWNSECRFVMRNNRVSTDESQRQCSVGFTQSQRMVGDQWFVHGELSTFVLHRRLVQERGDSESQYHGYHWADWDLNILAKVTILSKAELRHLATELRIDPDYFDIDTTGGMGLGSVEHSSASKVALQHHRWTPSTNVCTSDAQVSELQEIKIHQCSIDDLYKKAMGWSWAEQYMETDSDTEGNESDGGYSSSGGSSDPDDL
jgi:hypothetical protein